LLLLRADGRSQLSEVWRKLLALAGRHLGHQEWRHHGRPADAAVRVRTLLELMLLGLLRLWPLLLVLLSLGVIREVGLWHHMLLSRVVGHVLLRLLLLEKQSLLVETGGSLP